LGGSGSAADPVSLAQYFVDPNRLLHSNLNQGEFLLGITF
jgi:hypothetical protein